MGGTVSYRQQAVACLGNVRSIHDLNRRIDAAPVRVERRGNVLRARLTLPSRTGKPLVYVATVDMTRPAELGWFGSSFVRRARRKLRKRFPRIARIARGLVKLAKRAVKSRLLAAVWRTMPLWANVIPPPVGTALAAGAAAAQAAIAIGKKAAEGSQAAIAFVSRAKGIVREGRALVRAAKGSRVTPALQARARAFARERGAVRHTLAQAARVVRKPSPHYVVRTPSGRVVRIAASKVAA